MIVLFSLILAGSMLAAILIAVGVRAMPRLADLPVTSELPSLSVVVAARNEAHTIAPALRSLLGQQYPDLDITVVDDRSTDATRPIAEQLVAGHTHARVVHVPELPSGWLGKNHALQLGADAARSEYILFTDADVVFEATSLARAVSYCQAHSLDYLAVLPDMPRTHYWADAFFAEFALNGGLALQADRVLTGKPEITMGVGAFNLVKASAYRAIDGHRGIAMRADDDVALARVLKQAGFRQDVLIGTDMVVVAWYTGLRAGMRSLEKNVLAPFNYSVWPLLALMAGHFLGTVVPWLGLALGGTTVRLLAAGAIIARAVAWQVNARASARGLKYSAGMLATALLFQYTVFRAATMTLTQGGIWWRDTFYPLAQLRKKRI